jgi:hypothetical protein
MGSGPNDGKSSPQGPRKLARGGRRSSGSHQGDHVRSGKTRRARSPRSGTSSVEGKKETICFSACLS